MYSNYGYQATSPPVQITNNPFVSDPTSAQSRYPDISASSSLSGIGGNPTYPQQPGPYQQQISYQQTPQYSQGYQTGYQQQQGLAPQPTSQPFQPSSSFGQQLVGQINGSGYGYLQQQPTGYPGATQNAYNPAQQQIQQNPGYIAAFDPYAPIGQGWEGYNPQQIQQQQQSQFSNPTQSSFPSSSLSSSGKKHPRDLIRERKAELERWDQYSWKQLFNAFDSLKDAWEARKKELNEKIQQLTQQFQYSAGYQAGQIQQEGMRLQGLLKEADSNFDSCAASSFQLREVYAGYRQSGDFASKRRVRESCNAALSGLPDWPPAVY